MILTFYHSIWTLNNPETLKKKPLLEKEKMLITSIFFFLQLFLPKHKQNIFECMYILLLYACLLSLIVERKISLGETANAALVITVAGAFFHSETDGNLSAFYV